MCTSTIQIDQFGDIEWLDGSSFDYTVSDTNHIWRICISANVAIVNRLWELINQEERERAQRYYREKDKQRFIVGRAALRLLLGKYLNTNPKQIAFETGENKKPYVKGNTNIHYNVSHSGDYVLIAVSPSDVGVDVEHRVPGLHYTEIMPISFSQVETEWVNNSLNSLQSFYTLWTRKEALLKATAKGIDDSLSLVPAIDGTHIVNGKIIGSTKNWILKSFKVDEQHLGCIASGAYNYTFIEWRASLYL